MLMGILFLLHELMLSQFLLTIQEIQQEIIEEFSLFEDWMQRYEYMIELG